MQKLLFTVAIAFGLSTICHAETQAGASTTEKTQSPRDEKKIARKAERAHRILQACQAHLAELAEKGKALKGINKKMFDLFVAHANLEKDAAQDPEMAEHLMKHARHCNRYAANAKRWLEKAGKHTETAENTPPTKEEKK